MGCRWFYKNQIFNIRHTIKVIICVWLFLLAPLEALHGAHIKAALLATVGIQ